MRYVMYNIFFNFTKVLKYYISGNILANACMSALCIKFGITHVCNTSGGLHHVFCLYCFGIYLSVRDTFQTYLTRHSSADTCIIKARCTDMW